MGLPDYADSAVIDQLTRPCPNAFAVHIDQRVFLRPDDVGEPSIGHDRVLRPEADYVKIAVTEGRFFRAEVGKRFRPTVL